MSAVEPPPFLAELRQEFVRVAEADAQVVASAASASASSRFGRLRGPKLPSLRFALPALVAVVAVGGATVVATEVLPRSSDTPRVASGPSPQRNEGFDRALVERVAALGRTRTDGDVIPPDTVADVPASVRENLVVGTSLRVDPPAPPPDGAAAEFGADAWLLSTRSGELALLVRDGDKPAGVMVGYVEEVEQGLLLIGLGDDLIGVAPDGISRASVALQNGGRLVLPVRDNVFGARLNDRWVGHVQWGGMQRP